jgi:hypothetical protein
VTRPVTLADVLGPDELATQQHSATTILINPGVTPEPVRTRFADLDNRQRRAIVLTAIYFANTQHIDVADALAVLLTALEPLDLASPTAPRIATFDQKIKQQWRDAGFQTHGDEA